MSNLFLTSVGAGQSSFPTTTSSIGYGSSNALTIHSTAGVSFCNSSGYYLGTTISSSGLLNSNGLVVSSSITCNTLNITGSTGVITGFGTINSSGTITTNAVITCNNLTAAGSLTAGTLICNGPIIGFTSFIGTNCSISNIYYVSTGSLTCTTLSWFTSFTGISCTINNTTTYLSGDLTCNGNMTCSYSGTTNITCPNPYTISMTGPISGIWTGALTTKSLILTGASTSAGNLYVGPVTWDYNGNISGVVSLTTNGNLLVSSISCNKFICNISGDVSGVTTLNMSGQLTGTGNLVVRTFSCNNVGVVSTTIPYLTLNNLVCNGNGFKCTSAGAVSDVTSLSITGLLTIISGNIYTSNSTFSYINSTATITAASLNLLGILSITGTLTGSSYNGNNTNIGTSQTNVTATGIITSTTSISNSTNTFKYSSGGILTCNTLVVNNFTTNDIFKIGSSSSITNMLMGSQLVASYGTINFPYTLTEIPKVFLYGSSIGYNRVFTYKARNITKSSFYCILTFTNPATWGVNFNYTTINWIAIVEKLV